MKVAVVANTTWYVLNFRRNLLSALRAAGHETLAVAPEDESAAALRAAGFRLVHVPFSGAGKNPVMEWRTVRALRRTFRQERVDAVLSFTPKGNIYSALALRGLPGLQVANISGLGRAFVQGGWLATVARLLYRGTLRRATTVFFQNRDDHAFFLNERLVPADRARRLPGSGVDLAHFTTMPPAAEDAGLVFLMVARLIWEKGLAEFVEAARIARATRPDLRFMLLGSLDAATGRGPNAEQVARWVAEGCVEYLGSTHDVRPALAGAHCVVLPSYREGLPRSLLEAAATARPVITTDVPGCREALEPGVTGLLCRPRDAADLARRCLEMAYLGREDRREMGRQARLRVEQEFDERFVLDAYLEALATTPEPARAAR